MRALLTMACAGSILLMALAQQSKALSLAENNEFQEARDVLILPRIVFSFNPNLETFIEAGLLLEEGAYDEAKKLFESIPGFLTADNLLLESEYRQAFQLADAYNFAEATSLLSKLSEVGYRDAGTQLLEIQYRNASYLLYEIKDFSGAINSFMRLSQKGVEKATLALKETRYLWGCSLFAQGDYIGAYEQLILAENYLDAAEIRLNLQEVIYTEGQTAYRNDKFDKALEYFGCVATYNDADRYIVFSKIHDCIESGVVSSEELWWIDFFFEGEFRSVEQIVNYLMRNFSFEDAPELVLKDHSFAKQFLVGSWEGEWPYWIEVSEDGQSQYSLPCRGDDLPYYEISDGIYYTCDTSACEQVMQFKITAISPDCIQVLCYKDGSTHMLYRQ